VATGFFLAVDAGPKCKAVYGITAQHVIHAEYDGVLYIRLNTLDGKYRDIVTRGQDWQLHKHADAALYPFPFPFPDAIRGATLDPKSSAVPDEDGHYRLKMEAKDASGNVVHSHESFVRTGDEVTIVGLFTQEHGDEANLPIARFGHIARMPSIVSTLRWKNDDFRSSAFLIECLSWGGISGSPVLVLENTYRQVEKPGFIVKKTEFTFASVIGLVTGHKDISMKADVAVEGDARVEVITKLNTGIAVVTPVKKDSRLAT
jgi:hypothetical protein